MTDKPGVAERIDALTTTRSGVPWRAFFALAIAIALVVAFNTWSYKKTQRNTVAASKAQCLVAHLSRAALINLINRDNAPIQIPNDISPEFRAALEKKNQENEDYRKKAIEPLRQLNCRKVGDVPAPSPQPPILPPAPKPVPASVGLRGLPGKNGADGKPGRDGKDGKNGRDGKDGAIVVVPISPSPSPEPFPSISPSPEPSPTVSLLLPSPTDPVCILCLKNP
jgi:hypothetical protein